MASTVGAYTIEATLNADLEAESYGGAANNTRATAQNIDNSFINLGSGVSRGAVQGVSDPVPGAVEIEPNDSTGQATSAAATFTPYAGNLYHLGITGTISSSGDTDWYQLGALDAGDVLTVSESGSPSSRGTLGDSYVSLYRLDGTTPTLVAADDDSGPGTDSLIYQYPVSTAGIYYAVAGAYSTNTGTYALNLWLENAGRAPATGGTLTTETESNNTYATANDASTSWRPVQYVAQSSGTIATAADLDYYAYQFTAGDLVTVNTTAPRTNNVLTATATKSDADGDSVSLTFVWKVNGVIQQTHVAASGLTDTFNLSQFGGGNPGDVVTVEVTPNDGLTAGATVTGTATVVGSTRTWTGGGANDDWSTAANWAGNVVPVTGDQLVFAGATQTASFNDFADGTSFQSITFDNGDFTVSGHAVVLNPQGGVAIDSLLGHNTIALPLTLAPAATGTTIVQAGILQLEDSAQDPVLNSNGGADLRNGTLLLDYNGGIDPAPEVQSLLTTSYHNYTTYPFDSGQLRDSTATVSIGLGWADSPTINGHAYTNQVVIMPALYADANLDGVVNFSDLNKVLTNYNNTGMSWSQGDFNYDGVVSLNDLNKVLTNYGENGPVTLTLAALASVDTPAIPAPIGADSAAIAEPAVSAQPVAVVGSASETVPSQTDLVANVATADQGSSFVVRPPASAVYGVWPNGFRIAADRSTNRGTDVAENASLPIEVAAAVNMSSSSVPGENSTGGEPTNPEPMKTVFADQARAHDAVLAGEVAAPANEVSCLSDVAHTRGRRNSAGDLESLTDAVDDALAAHDYGV